MVKKFCPFNLLCISYNKRNPNGLQQKSSHPVLPEIFQILGSHKIFISYITFWNLESNQYYSKHFNASEGSNYIEKIMYSKID